MPLTQDDQVKYKDLYLQTAKPYIAQLQDAFTQFSQGTYEQEKIEVAHRSAHSLTSQSIMMGYTQIGKLASLLEKIMKAKVDNQLQFTPEIGTALKAAADRLLTAVESIENNTAEVDLTAAVASLTNITHISV